MLGLKSSPSTESLLEWAHEKYEDPATLCKVENREIHETIDGYDSGGHGGAQKPSDLEISFPGHVSYEPDTFAIRLPTDPLITKKEVEPIFYVHAEARPRKMEDNTMRYFGHGEKLPLAYKQAEYKPLTPDISPELRRSAIDYLELQRDHAEALYMRPYRRPDTKPKPESQNADTQAKNNPSNAA